ncbi:MAG: phosphatidylserine/phosphatidylglycerophosphate/cardiolipin synthase family protein [Deltaproteobacteria bacterium]|nr:phosphatidylserine/phosphatidylglycerophosphate/cardiolipin synthase family protein [Deltaproteobacteria bacterium]
MCCRRVLTALVLLAAAALAPAGARAEAYPWVDIHDDVRLVADPYTDLEVRLYLISQARRSIDLALYEQGDDEVGLPVLAALRQAADRGVKVRVITQWFFQYLYHPLNQSPSYVTDPPTAVPIEYIVFGSPASVVKHGWHPSDGVHGKVLIVDDAWALTTGRGHAAMNLRWIDSSNLLKGELVRQVAEAFGKLWELARLSADVIRPALPRVELSEQQRDVHVPPSARHPDGPWRRQLDELIRWMHAPSRPDGVARRGRLLHTDFVAQMTALRRQGKNPRTWDERLGVIQDPVLDALETRLARTGPGSQVRFTSMYAVLHPRVKAAVCGAAQRGAVVTMLTNGDYESPPISTLAWFAAIRDLDEVVRCGVSLHTFRRVKGLPWNFTHLKLVVVDDTTYFGSHNLNLASTLANDELFVEVDDPGLAAESRAFFDHVLRESAEKAPRADMEAARPLGGIGRRILDPVLGFW